MYTLCAGAEGWLYVSAKRPHSHDVRTLLTLASEGEPPLLLSVRSYSRLKSLPATAALLSALTAAQLSQFTFWPPKSGCGSLLYWACHHIR